MTGPRAEAGRDAASCPDEQALYDALVAQLSERFPRFRVVPKADSPLQRLIGGALRALTLGGQDRYMSDYVTTLGQRVYVPSGWEARPPGERWLVMRHEAVHVRQFQRLGWPLTAIVYLLLPLPVGFAAGRAWLEWEGYRETLRATWALRGEAAARSPTLHDELVRRFTGPDYAWMWLRGKTIRLAIARELARLARSPPAPPRPHEDVSSVTKGPLAPDRGP